MPVFRPQPGFQTRFMSSPADIVIGGSGAGTGKSYALTLLPLAYHTVPGFQWGVFRRTYPELTGPGSIWLESRGIYPFLGATANQNAMSWHFPTPGVECKMSHLQHEHSVEAHRSKQYAGLIFDELTTFTEHQFWYMLSRNRSTCGVRSFLRAGTNPEPNWLAKLLAWWITCDGYPDPDRADKIRWFVRMGDTLKWGDDPIALEHNTGKRPLSMSFVPGSIKENKILLKSDPEYYHRLDSLPHVQRERLLKGNWHVRPRAGDYFDRAWFTPWDFHRPPEHFVVKWVRAWDLAATPVFGDQYDISPKNAVGETPRKKDPDWTYGVRVGLLKPGMQCRFIISDVRAYRDRAEPILEAIKSFARQDGPGTTVALFQDPAQAGLFQRTKYERAIRAHAGCRVTWVAATQNLAAYADWPSRAAQQGSIYYMPSPRMAHFFNQLESFPSEGDSEHDDAVAALGRAFVDFPESVVLESADRARVKHGLSAEAGALAEFAPGKGGILVPKGSGLTRGIKGFGGVL